MAAATILVVAVIIFGLFAPLQGRVGLYELHVVDIYDSARYFSWVYRTFDLLGVSVILNLTYPSLLVVGENFTFSFSLVVGDAPEGWKLNVTSVVFEGDCFQRITTVVNKVLTGRQQLTGQFNVKIVARLAPGYTGRCDANIMASYSAVFGKNSYAGYFPVSKSIPLKSKELPLSLSFDIQDVKKSRHGEGYVFNASIRVRNTLKDDIAVTTLKYCPRTYENSPERVIGCSWNFITFTSIVLKPGEERAFIYQNVLLDDGSRHLAFVVQYLYEGGHAENWLVLSVHKVAPAAGGGTATNRTETTPAGGVTTTPSRRELGMQGGIITTTPRSESMTLNEIGWLAALLVLIIGTLIVKWNRRTRAGPADPGAYTGPTTLSHQTTLETHQTSSFKSQELRKLRVPADFDIRCTTIHTSLQTAYRYYFEFNDERAGVRALYDAVNSLLNLIFEAEGISIKRSDNPRFEIIMREKVRRLVRLGWVSPDSSEYFEKLQVLRNLTSHSHEMLHRRLTRPEDISDLFSFFNSYIPDTIAKLRTHLHRSRQAEEKPGHKSPTYIG